MSRQRLPLLGVTGGIGSGKSTALAFLRELGACVVSSDDVVHQLLSEAAIVAAVRERFGDGVIDGDVVSRPALARVVFHDRGQLDWLEGLLHPHVRERVAAWAREAEKKAPRPALLVAEVPLLFETGWYESFDYTMLITAPAGVRRRRLSAKLTDSEFARRLEQQMPEDEKIRLARFVCHNTGSRKQLRGCVGEAFATIVAAAAEAEADTSRR